MRHSGSGIVAVVVAIAVMAFGAGAGAEIDESAPAFDSQPELSHISQELEEQWDRGAASFATVEAARQLVADWGRRGGQRPPRVASMLAGEDDELLEAMLWRLAADDPMASGMDLRAWRRWRIGLIEAIGRLRDERSLPVLYAVIAGGEPDERIRQAATSALGRVGDVSYIERVVKQARADERHRPAIIAGLGDARRLVALDYLVEVVEETDDETERVAAVRAVGDWANQWAWQTSSLAEFRGEGRQGRSRVVETLVDEYPNFGPEVRREAAKSLQLADSAQTADRALERARQAGDTDRRAAWYQLAETAADSVLD